MKQKLDSCTFNNIRRDVVLAYVLFLMSCQSEKQYQPSLRQMTLNDLADAIDHITEKQTIFIRGKIKNIFHSSPPFAGEAIVLHYFFIKLNDDINMPFLQIKLLRNNFLDEFNVVKLLFARFSPFFGGALKIIDQKNMAIYY